MRKRKDVIFPLFFCGFPCAGYVRHVTHDEIADAIG